MIPNTSAKIAIIVSEYHSEITDKLLNGAYDTLLARQCSPENISIIRVPGAIEIPLTAKLLAESQRFQAIIVLGAVVRGESDHYLYVCQQVSQGCQQVMLTYNLPIVFGVLTTHTWEQALDRVSPDNHKGIEVAETTLKMLEVMSTINRT